MAFNQNQQLQQLLSPMPQMSPMQRSPSYSYQTSPMQKQPMFGSTPIQQNNGFLGGLRDYFLGSSPQFAYSSPYGQNQQQGFNQLLQMGMENQQNPYAGFEPIRQQIYDQFYNTILPRLTEQFGSTGGAASSPQFAQTLRSGGQSLANMIGAHQQQYGQQNREFGLRQAQLGLTPQYENSYIPGQEGFISSVANRTLPLGLSLYGLSRFGGI